MLRLSKHERFISVHFAQMFKILFISYEHNNYVWVSVLSQFLIPFLYVPKGGFPTDVINQQCTHSSSVIRIGDCFVPFLARSVPYLNFYYLVVYLDRTSCKLNSDCGF